MSSVELLFLGFTVMCFPFANGNHDTRRLFDNLFNKYEYNKMARPVNYANNSVQVKIGIKLTQVDDVDEKNQILTLSMWLIHKWVDESLKWNPVEYGGVNVLYVPADLIWLPDVVLYNTADGDYTVTIMTKVELTASGAVSWEPPAIFKAQCEMDMQYFPFDEQDCMLKYGAWSHDREVVDLQHIWFERDGLKDETDVIKTAIDLQGYHPSIEWDIMAVPARKNIISYPCCTESYPDITFNITLRRKTLYFAYSLIIPVISINMLTILTFYLPTHSGEKISLCISILLSLSVFQLLLMDLVPATSLTTPLIGRYILFTMTAVTGSVVITVIIQHVSLRSSATHDMPDFTRKLCLNILPRILLMRRPRKEIQEQHEFPDISSDCTWGNPYRGKLKGMGDEPDLESILGNYTITSNFIGSQLTRFAFANMGDFCTACAKKKMSSYPPSAIKALESCVFVAKHIQDEDDGTRVKEDWIFLAMVIDRLFLYIFLSVMTITAMAIYLNAPSLYDNKMPLEFGQVLSTLTRSLGNIKNLHT